jgi:hypothetical protein
MLVLAGTALALTLGGGGTRAPHPVAGVSAPGRFVAPTTRRDGHTSLLVQLPDGRGFDLAYPTAFDLSKMTVTAGSQVVWSVRTGGLRCCDEYLSPVYGDVASIFGSARPIAVYRGADGRSVRYFSGADAGSGYYEPGMDYLAFQFGHWVVLAMDIGRSGYSTARMTETQRATWARSFHAHVDRAGYLIFDPRPPLTLYRGDRTIDVVLHGGANLIEITGPTSCQGEGSTQALPRVITNPPGLGWCDAGAGVRVSVTGATGFVRGLASTLRMTAVGRR